VFLGVDIGSASGKAVALSEEGEIAASAILVAQGGDANLAARLRAEALDRLGGMVRFDRVVATGRGRLGVSFADRVVSDILCQARGVTHLLPGSTVVFDMGGRDVRLIVLDRFGELEDFEIEHGWIAVMRSLLGLVGAAIEEDVEGLGRLRRASRHSIEIDGSSTVHAEHQVVTLLASGWAHEDIVAAIQRAIAARLARLVEERCGCGISAGLVLTGGLALQRGIVEAFGDRTGVDAIVAPEPEMTGAIGAATIARAMAHRESRCMARPRGAFPPGGRD
jgi:predicted CoA-substrate-specific enzyme activase